MQVLSNGQYRNINTVDDSLKSLDEVKSEQIAILNQICRQSILSGFRSKAFDGVTEKHYDCEMTDQSRITGLVNVAQMRIQGLTNEILKWKASEELECYEWDIQQILTLGLDMKKHIEENTDKFYGLRKQILVAETKEAVRNYSW